MDKIESLLVDIMELKLLTNKNHINNSNEFNNKIKEVKNLIEDIPLDSCFSTDSDIIFSCKFSKFLYRNTFRKTSYNTMFVHAYKVAEILYRNNASKETVIAGLLHDVIEDTPYKEYILRIFFNDVIMNTVLFHTEDKSKSWEIRKLTTINEVKDDENSEGVWLILADRIANMEDMILSYPIDWNIFNRGVEKQYWYFSEIYKYALEQKSIFPELNYYKDCMDMLFEDFLLESKV